MEVNPLPLPVLMDERVGIQPKTFAAWVGVCYPPVSDSQDALKIGAINRNAEDQPPLGGAEKDGNGLAQCIAVGWLDFDTRDRVAGSGCPPTAALWLRVPCYIG